MCSLNQQKQSALGAAQYFTNKNGTQRECTCMSPVALKIKSTKVQTLGANGLCGQMCTNTFCTLQYACVVIDWPVKL